MIQRAGHHSKSPVVRRLRKTLELVAETTPQSSFKEADQFICSVCNLPIQPCKADSRAKCFHMLREGTELQALFVAQREHRSKCLVCGKLLSRKLLAQKPTAELCPACTKKSIKGRTTTKSERNVR